MLQKVYAIATNSHETTFPVHSLLKKKKRDLLQTSNLKKTNRDGPKWKKKIQFYRNLGNNECRLFGCRTKKRRREIDDSS